MSPESLELQLIDRMKLISGMVSGAPGDSLTPVSIFSLSRRPGCVDKSLLLLLRGEC